MSLRVNLARQIHSESVENIMESGRVGRQKRIDELMECVYFSVPAVTDMTQVQ
jgi:hypothetical protein